MNYLYFCAIISIITYWLVRTNNAQLTTCLRRQRRQPIEFTQPPFARSLVGDDICVWLPLCTCCPYRNELLRPRLTSRYPPLLFYKERRLDISIHTAVSQLGSEIIDSFPLSHATDYGFISFTYTVPLFNICGIRACILPLICLISLSLLLYNVLLSSEICFISGFRYRGLRNYSTPYGIR